MRPQDPLDEGYWKALLEDVERWTQEAAGGHSNAEEAWRRAEDGFRNQEFLELTVEGYNRGGLLVNLWGLEGFVPASHLEDLQGIKSEEERKNGLAHYRGETLKLRIIEVDRTGGRLVLSPVRKEARNKVEGIAPGQVRRGRVSRVTDFGAFVDLGGIEGLIHISELSWDRVSHPSQILRVGDEIDVYIREVDEERGRLALSRKRLQPDPWAELEKRYQVGQVVEGLITRVVDFGAFARLEEGIEGLIHISELAEGSFLHPRNVVREGDVVRVRILSIDAPRRRMGLSLKQAKTKVELGGR